MDNFGVNESEIALSGLRIEFLPPRSHAKYKTLDHRLISPSKMRFQSNLLRMTINVVLQKQSGAWYFLASSEQGFFDIRDGFSPTIGDTIEIFDEAQHATYCSTVIKCWLKSQCLPESYSEIQSIERDPSIVQSLVIPRSPTNVILEEAYLVNNTVALDEVLNSATQFHNEPSSSEVYNSILQEILTSASNQQKRLPIRIKNSGSKFGIHCVLCYKVSIRDFR